MTIYPDTNTLIYEVQTKFSLEKALLDVVPPPHNVVILEAVQKELQTLSEKNGRTGRAATVALALIKQKDLKIKSTTLTYGDKALLHHATSEDYVVTTDKELIQKLKGQNTSVLIPRQKHTLLKI